MKHTPEFTHFFLYHLLPLTAAVAIFLMGIYLVVKDANNVLRNKKGKQKLIKHVRERRK